MNLAEKRELFKGGAATVRHMARAIMEMHEFWATAIDHVPEGVVEMKLVDVDKLMNMLGDYLNALDAVEDDDDFTDQVFDDFRKYFASITPTPRSPQ